MYIYNIYIYIYIYIFTCIPPYGLFFGNALSPSETITDMLGQESLAPKFLIEGVISFPQIWLSVAKCSNKKEQKKVVQEAFKIFLSFTGAFRTQSSN